MAIITIYHRKFPIKGAPVAVSLLPYPTSQKHTFAVGTEVFEASYHESRVEVPGDATIDPLKNLLCWASAKGKLKSTAREVLDFAKAGVSGFRVARKADQMA